MQLKPEDEVYVSPEELLEVYKDIMVATNGGLFLWRHLLGLLW